MAVAAPAPFRTSWRPSILDGYMLRMLTRPAASVLAVTLVAFLLEQTLRLIKELSSSGAHLNFLFGMITNLIPYHLGLALPAAFFVAMFMVIARLDEDSEIDAILAGGVSFERMVAPLVFIGVLLTIVSLLLTGFLQPYARFGYRAVRNAALEAGWTAQLDPQVFMSAGPNFTITADEVDATGRDLKGVFIRKSTPEGEMIVTAKEGKLGLKPDGKTTELTLNGGVGYADGPHGNPRLLRFGNVTDFETLGGAEKLKPRGGDEQELTTLELLQEMKRPDALIPKLTLEAELYSRLARSLAIPFLPLLALPLAMAAKRGRRAPGMIVGAVILVGYHHGVTLAKNFARNGAVPPIVALGGMFLLIGGFGLWLFLSSRRRPGETPISGLFHLFETFFERRSKVKPTAMQTRGGLSLTGYLSRIFAVRTLVAVAALLGLLQLIDLLERTSDILARGGVLDIGRYLLLRLPSMFQQICGFAVLAGALFTFNQLAQSSEMVAMRATGLSLWQIFRRALPVVLAVAAIDLVVAEEFTPRAEQALASWWDATAPAAQKKAPEAKWFRIGDDLAVAQAASGNGDVIRHLSIYERDPDTSLHRRLTAASATPEPGGWRLHDAVVTDIGQDRAVVTSRGDMHWDTTLSAGDVARLFSDSYDISSRTALKALTGKEPVTRAPSEFKTRLYRTLAEGFAPIIALMLALPAALGHPRSNKTGPLLFGLGGGLLYLVVDGLLTAMGSTGVLPPAIAAWGAPLAFGAGVLTVLLYIDE
ncbi:MAG TPA: LptF/LptG family permease [Caulobacteraceae bacterium]|nr:LptF/LptG family permease [Caulobacteraceae bacterium]